MTTPIAVDIQSNTLASGRLFMRILEIVKFRLFLPRKSWMYHNAGVAHSQLGRIGKLVEDAPNADPRHGSQES
jgi:hypothetical protein